jgi:cobalt-precorrin-5B (C1)-methyltransferase
MGIEHVAGATGSASEAAVQKLHSLPEVALIDMGDFAGGMLKYIAAHPVGRVTVAGGVAKMTKLAQGRLDLHSKRGSADLPALADLARGAGAADPVAAAIAQANTVAHAFAIAADAGIALGDAVARGAWQTAAGALRRADIELEIVVFDRDGALKGRAPFAPAHAPPPRNRRT